ncbi:excreted virulence factor EspC (type VII ESX diderm) [Saccharothrix saharensis]|uniref:Excreted virulence factor EspC (Type VII ESX diderm) n=1 Tax=Saccharothrix saharensis TaxID=571190 RepID=A0A543J950_9PSEU|nr:type VII secretion target [Saccharothrix saharensis]TQM79352.1 excreted virulence factor EspC (type VII ESX diderm) [Saccharothrix saharensis]
MADGFTVDSAELAGQAAALDGLASRADTAADAGRHVTSLDDAYGLLCRPFADLLREPQQRGVDTLQATAENLHRLVADLGDTAKVYREAEEKITAVMRALVRSLEAMSAAPRVGGGN